MVKVTGPRKLNEKKAVKEADETLIHFQDGYLELWSQQFREAFN